MHVGGEEVEECGSGSVTDTPDAVTPMSHRHTPPNHPNPLVLSLLTLERAIGSAEHLGALYDCVTQMQMSLSLCPRPVVQTQPAEADDESSGETDDYHNK